MSEGNGKARKRFSVVRKVEEVEIEDLSGEVRVVKVREMSGPQRDAYMRTRQDNWIGGDPAKGVKNPAGIITNLLKFCLYNEKDELITVEEMDKWSSTAQEALAQVALEINGLAGQQAKKEEADPTAPSVPAG